MLSKWTWIIWSLKNLGAPKEIIEKAKNVKAKLVENDLDWFTENWMRDYPDLTIGNLEDLDLVVSNCAYCPGCICYPDCDDCPVSEYDSILDRLSCMQDVKEICGWVAKFIEDMNS